MNKLTRMSKISFGVCLLVVVVVYFIAVRLPSDDSKKAPSSSAAATSSRDDYAWVEDINFSSLALSNISGLIYSGGGGEAYSDLEYLSKRAYELSAYFKDVYTGGDGAALSSYTGECAKIFDTLGGVNESADSFKRQYDALTQCLGELQKIYTPELGKSYGKYLPAFNTDPQSDVYLALTACHMRKVSEADSKNGVVSITIADLPAELCADAAELCAPFTKNDSFSLLLPNGTLDFTDDTAARLKSGGIDGALTDKSSGDSKLKYLSKESYILSAAGGSQLALLYFDLGGSGELTEQMTYDLSLTKKLGAQMVGVVINSTADTAAAVDKLADMGVSLVISRSNNTESSWYSTGNCAVFKQGTDSGKLLRASYKASANGTELTGISAVALTEKSYGEKSYLMPNISSDKTMLFQ